MTHVRVSLDLRGSTVSKTPGGDIGRRILTVALLALAGLCCTEPATGPMVAGPPISCKDAFLLEQLHTGASSWWVDTCVPDSTGWRPPNPARRPAP